MTASVSERVRPRKALAQHFLVDRHILSRIIMAAQLAPEDVVVEVGPGLGSLTRCLVSQVVRVVAVELDPTLADSLPHRLGGPSNLTIVVADARTVSIATLVGQDTPYKVVANLPYYAAKPIVRRFLEAAPRPKLLVVMVQEEVAHSMTAAPGKMTLLSVATQFYATASLVCTVPPSAFRPPPKVTSAVVRLEPRAAPPVEVGNSAAFFGLVRAGFAAPRKQLRNSLSQGLPTSTTEVEQCLAAAGLDGRRRPATLSLEEWARLYRSWTQRRTGGSSGLR